MNESDKGLVEQVQIKVLIFCAIIIYITNQIQVKLTYTQAPLQQTHTQLPHSNSYSTASPKLKLNCLTPTHTQQTPTHLPQHSLPLTSHSGVGLVWLTVQVDSWLYEISLFISQIDNKVLPISLYQNYTHH